MFHKINISYMYGNVMFIIFFIKNIGIFSSISIRCIFSPILSPSINNNYANLCIWILLKLLKIVLTKKNLILLRNWDSILHLIVGPYLFTSPIH